MKAILISILTLYTSLSFAEQILINDILYMTGYKDDTCYVFGYNRAMTKGIIQSQINFDGNIYSVSKIDNGAFEDCLSLTNIFIPASIEEIGHSAFEDCHSLISVEIPNRVTSIEKSAFQYCYSLTNISIPSSVISIKKSAFSNCRSLASISLPSRLPLIENRLFYRCTSLTNISIPASVRSIGEDAFFECSSLSNLVIPSSVTTIGQDAFNHCYCLSHLEFKGDAPKIDFSSMSYMTNLTIYYHSGAEGFTSPTWQGYPSKMIYDLIPTKKYKGKLNLKKGAFSINIWSKLPQSLMGQPGPFEVTLSGKPLMSFENVSWNSNKTSGKASNNLKEKVTIKLKYEKSCLKLTSKYALTEKFNQIISQGEGTLRLTFADTDKALAIPIKWDQKGKLIP